MLMLFKQMLCDYCTGNHSSIYCQMEKPFAQPNFKEVNYLSNLQCQNNPYSNTFNPRWKNYPNFSWSTNQGATKPT